MKVKTNKKERWHMIDKIIRILKEYSDDDSKRGKSLKEFSMFVSWFGGFVIMYCLTTIILKSHLGISKEVADEMSTYLSYGVCVYMAGALLPWMFRHKYNIMNIFERDGSIKSKEENEIEQNDKGE
ncbi:TPA: hypothetical protein ACTYF4_004532 [Enterobacter hormaechei]